MIRLLTAPLLGAFVGALEGGIFFFITTVIDVELGRPSGWEDPFLLLITMYGIIFGGFVGGVIGLIVALRHAGGSGGLLIGSAIGVVCSIYVVMVTAPSDLYDLALAIVVLPAAASMGLLSAVLTARRKEPEPATEAHKSGRVLS